MVRRLSIQRIFFAFIFSFTVILLASCTIQKSGYEPSQNVSSDVIPYSVQYGKHNIIKPGRINWRKNESLALVPSSPYVYQEHILENLPVDIVSHKQFAYLLNKVDNKHHLQIIHFPDKGKAKSISNTFIEGEINKLHHANNRLILTRKTGGIDIIDVSNSKFPVKLSHLPTRLPVVDVQFNGASAYLLLEDNTLLDVKFNTNPGGTLSTSILHKWQLPLPAAAIAIYNNYVWLAGERGVGIIKLDKQSATAIDLIETTGNPDDIQILNDLALITDNTGGLVIFDVKDKEKLAWKGSYNKRGSINKIIIPESTSHSESAYNREVFALLGNETIMSIGLANPQLPSSGSVYKPESPIITSTSLDDDVLLVTQNAIQRIKMVDANTNSVSPEGVNQGGSRRGVIRDNILYVADWFSGLHLYDISIPQHPRHLSNYHTPGSSKGVTLFGDYVLIGDDDQGLQIIDVEDPHEPIWVSELTPASLAGEGLAYTMKRVGKTLYLADHRGGFHIIDLTDVYHPKRLGGYDTPGKSWGIDVYNNYVYVADDQSGLLVFDATDVKQPKLVGQFNPGGQAEDVAIQDNRAYVVFFDKGLYVLDINNPRQPVVLGHTSIPGNARGIELADGLAYVAGWESGLHIVDTRGPNIPRIIGSYDTDGSAWGVNAWNGYAYVLDWWGGIKVIDVRQPSSPSYVGQYHARGTLQQLRTRNRYLYAASGAGGVQVFDIKNPLNPIWIIGIDIPGHTQDVWHDESRAYVAAGDGGVVLLDTLDPFYTWRIGQIDTPGLAQQVRAWNDYLLINDSLEGILVFDTRNPQQPQQISRFRLKARDLWVDDSAFWVSTEQGLVWWPHEEGYITPPRHRHTITGGTDWVRTNNQLVITGERNGRIQIWQQSPKGLEKLSDFPAGEPILDIKTVGNELFVMGANSGLLVFNIKEPRFPYLMTAYPATGRHTAVEIANGAAFFAGENRMASVTLLPGINRESSRVGEVSLHLPPDLPTGQYHLLKTDQKGEKQLFPNALNVQFSRPSRSITPLERYRQLLKSPR